MENELKPCPFCGGDAAIKEHKDGSGGVYCTECKFEPLIHASYHCQEDKPKAIEEWNRRTPDIDISPDRLQEIILAEKDGRLVVLPCKVGDTVYAWQPLRISEFCVDPLHGEIVTAKVIEITLKDGIEWMRLYSDDDRIADYRGESFGKTVFLTKEAAEAALKEAKE